MNKIWALLFLAVPIGGVVFYYLSYAKGWWQPESISSFGGDIDLLFNVILWITAVTFVVTQGVLVYSILRFGDGSPTRRVNYIHGSHRLEVTWTTATALMLLFIALVQMPAWRNIKFRSAFPAEALSHPLVEVTGRQFEWRFRYAGVDGQLNTKDDVFAVNLFHVPVDTTVGIRLRSEDVIHSFFFPNLRLKQDAVPGMTIPMWFKATKTGEYDLFCAELCGWGHYKMRGRLIVQSQPEFDKWLADTYKAQEAYR